MNKEKAIAVGVIAALGVGGYFAGKSMLASKESADKAELTAAAKRKIMLDSGFRPLGLPSGVSSFKPATFEGVS